MFVCVHKRWNIALHVHICANVFCQVSFACGGNSVRVDGRTGGKFSDGRTDGKFSDGRTDGKILDGRTDGKNSDGRTDGQKNFGRTDGRTDERTKKKIEKFKVCLKR